MKKVFTCTLVGILLVTTITSQTVVASDVQSKINKLEKDKEQIKKEQNHLNKSQQTTESKMKDNLLQQDQIHQELNKIEQELTETQVKLDKKETEIKETNKKIDHLQEEIDQLKKDIQELKERIEKREELLKNRLLSIQKSGGSTRFIEVILGSQSFADFISRSLAMNTIMDQDQLIMEEHASDKLSLETKQNHLEEQKIILEEKKEELEEQKNELAALKNKLDQQASKKESLMKQLKVEYDQLEEHKMSLEEERKILKEQEKIIEQEKGKLEQLSINHNNQNAGGSGIFIWPTKGRISSPYGSRSFNGGGFHYGLDIAAPQGTSVVAAASGVVIRASYSPSYGNVVFIHHPQLNKSTVYAHLHSIGVNAGATVSSGQQVGTVGNTGNSFGNHLHFEVHNGLWSHRAGINPMKFLP